MQPVLCVELEKKCGKAEQEQIRRELLEIGRSLSPYQRYQRDSLPPGLPGGYPPQRQDLPRETGGLGEGADYEGTCDRWWRFSGWRDRAHAARARRPGAQLLAGRRIPHWRDLGVEQVRGDLGDRAAVMEAATGLRHRLPRGGQGRHLGELRGFLPGQRDRHRERPGSLPGQRYQEAGLHQLTQRGL